METVVTVASAVANPPRIGRSVSRRTVYNRIRSGHLQTLRTIGGSQRVLLESLPVSRRQN